MRRREGGFLLSFSGEVEERVCTRLPRTEDQGGRSPSVADSRETYHKQEVTHRQMNRNLSDPNTQRTKLMKMKDLQEAERVVQ